MQRKRNIRCLSLALLVCLLLCGSLQVYAVEVPPLQELPVPGAMYWIDMPWFDQNDYPSVAYGSGTVANNGSSVTALAMVASYMTGHPYTPEDLAVYFGGEAENNIARLETGSRTLKLSWSRARNWNAVVAALKKGKVAILLLNGPCAFTDTQHFVVLKGITNDGKVLVNDPNGQNYGKSELAYGLTYGFETKELVKYYDGAWIYDKEAMRSNPTYYQEKEIDRSNPRYPHLTLTDEDIDLIARLVWAEARGESERGQQAVAEVILNRLNSPDFPNSVRDILYAPDQFRTVSQLDKATPSQTQFKAVERAIYGPYVLPENVFYFGQEMPNFNVWGTIGGHVFCFAQGFPK